MKKITIILPVLLIIAISFSACGKESAKDEKEKNNKISKESYENNSEDSEELNKNKENVVKKVNSEEAKSLIKDDSAILVDVRTIEEHEEKHIEGDVLIPLDQLEKQITEKIPNKDTKIILYCRSGNRSAKAGNKLLKMGYTNLYDLGSINSWEE